MCTSFGKYDLRQEIGRGPGFVLYEAVDPALQRDVALKILSLPEEADPVARWRAVEQFCQEGRALAGLSHPNLAAVLDVGEAGGGCYLALELIRGSTLRERLTALGPLPPGEVARIGIAICQALEHMHRRGVIHREVTPDQILLLPDGRVSSRDSA